MIGSVTDCAIRHSYKRHSTTFRLSSLSACLNLRAFDGSPLSFERKEEKHRSMHNTRILEASRERDNVKIEF